MVNHQLVHSSDGRRTTQVTQRPTVIYVAVELRVKDQLDEAFVGAVRAQAVHVVHGQVQPVQRPLPMPIAPVVNAVAGLHRDDRDETGLNLVRS